MQSVFVFGSLNIDLSFFHKTLPTLGETLKCESFLFGFGGKGANQAVQIANNSIPVSLIGAIGDDSFGKSYSEHLSKCNHLTPHLAVVPSTSTGVASILIDKDGHNLISISGGANEKLPLSVLDTLNLQGIVLCQGELSFPTTFEILSRTKASNCFTVLNFAPISKFDPSQFNLGSVVDLLIVNEHEAIELLKIFVPDFNLTTVLSPIQDSIVIAQELNKFFSEVVITLGANGAVVVSRELTAHVSGLKVENIVDTSGAGDSAVASIVSSLAVGASLVDSVRVGMHTASLKIQRRGAQNYPSHSRSEFMELVNKCRV
ncbi:hypothetical protein RCL1_006741 [Eukaryota sp. TZLM3-RCL]